MAYQEWRKSHPPLPAPKGTTFDPESIPRLELSDEEWEAFHGTLESFRKPRPWSDPWDLA